MLSLLGNRLGKSERISKQGQGQPFVKARSFDEVLVLISVNLLRLL